MGLEPGVSVYDCCRKRGKWMICIPNPIHPFTADTLKDFVTDIIDSTVRKIYLVIGTYVGGLDQMVNLVFEMYKSLEILHLNFKWIIGNIVLFLKVGLLKNICPHKIKSFVVLLQKKWMKRIARVNPLAISFFPLESTSLYRHLLRKEEYLIYG